MPDRFTPVYFRIQQRLRGAIACGALKPGDKLPSESDLCAEFSTTRSTVRHALSLLDYEGLIVREPGRGTFVAEPFHVTGRIDTGQPISFEAQVAAAGANVTYRDAKLSRMKAPSEVASALSLRPGTLVFRLDRLRVIGVTIVGHEMRYMPTTFGGRVTQDMIDTKAAHSFVSEILGVTVPTIKVSMFAETANAEIAERLAVPLGSAVLVRDHTYHDEAGNVLLMGCSTFRGDIRVSFTLGRELLTPST